MDLKQPVTSLANIGPRRQALLNRLNIYTVGDLIRHYPRNYQDRSNVVAPSQVKVNETNTVVAVISKPPENTSINGRIVTVLTLSDGRGSLDAVWYNQPYMRHAFKKNEEIAFIGHVTQKSGRLQMSAPEFEKLGEGESLSFGRVIPVYPSTAGLSQKMIRGLVKNVLDKIDTWPADVLPASVKERYGLCGKTFAVSNIHFPESDESFFQARKHLVFEELLVMQAALFKMKGAMRQPSPFRFANPDDLRFMALLPFVMTNAQRRALEEIKEDLRSGYVMNRLVQGDVGCGKTSVAMAAAFIVAESGAQSALMAPTEVLARQHYASCKPLFDWLGIEIQLLSGSLEPSEKHEIRERIADGSCKLVIGTHAVIQDSVTFKDLRLVITDEQHRFGVRQRTSLAGKGDAPHVLAMSATPIPRTLGLILYGDMDVSVIDELPPRRLKVDTIVVDSGFRRRMFDFIDREISAGRQAYVVCPLIQESEKIQMQAVMTYVEELRSALPHCTIEYMHGKLAPEVKSDVMSWFSDGLIDVIVSTTVIEVGVDVPNATLMIVENAERFGLSQLHQLRGRVGRGSEKSYCVLVTDSKTDICKERMKAMTDTNDGFVISERDLALRGPGDFFGVRQHGLPELRIANLYRDLDILKDVQSCARELFEEDEHLENPENALLAAAVNRFFKIQAKKFSL